MIINRGDIFYISHAKYYATDPGNTAGRPGVIVSSNELNKHADSVEVVYLTTQEKRPMSTHAEVICKIPSTALCETIYTVNKDRIGDFIKTCTDEEMKGIEQALLNSLDIDISKGENTAEIERNLYKKLYEDLLVRLLQCKSYLKPETNV